MTNNPLKAWMTQATAAEKRALALAAGTSYDSLHQMAKAYRTGGKLRITPDMARKLEIASKGALRREDLCPACGRCELASLARQEDEHGKKKKRCVRFAGINPRPCQTGNGWGDSSTGCARRATRCDWPEI